jgi:hypothetical protein
MRLFSILSFAVVSTLGSPVLAAEAQPPNQPRDVEPAGAAPKVAPPPIKHAGAQVIAVLEFRDKLPKEGDKLDVSYVSDVVRSAAKEALPGLRVMTRENMLVLLEATGRKLEQCEGECEVDTGRRVGADLIISGEVLRFGTRFKVNMKLHDTHDGELLAGSIASGGSVDELDTELGKAVVKLMAPLREGTAQPPSEPLAGSSAAPGRRTTGEPPAVRSGAEPIADQKPPLKAPAPPSVQATQQPAWTPPQETPPSLSTTVHRHFGLYLRFDPGAGYMSSTENAGGVDYKISGLAGSFGIAIGYALFEGFIVAFHVFDSVAVNPSVSVGGQSANSTDTTLTELGIGGQLTYYFSSNFYLSASIGASKLSVQTSSKTTNADTGVAGRLALGYEWWISDHWGLGFAANATAAANPDPTESGTSNTLTTTAFALVLSATYN